MKKPGLQLEALCTQADYEVLLVAPFIKSSALDRLLSNIDRNIKFRCVTRWRPDEISAGVSDLDVWLLIKDRPDSTLWLRSDLHAKYYRGDQRALVGSANLTNTALGWSQQPNLELLISSDVLEDFEQELFTGSIVVDDALYMHVKKVVDEFYGNEIPNLERTEFALEVLDEDDIPKLPLETWLPMLRHPKNLYIAYAGNWEQLGTGSRVAARHDLLALELPTGLTREQFQGYVGIQLLQRPIIREVDQFLGMPQRFGAVSDFLKSLLNLKDQKIDTDLLWQTLMRWMLHFMPERYSYAKLPHSEIISRVDR